MKIKCPKCKREIEIEDYDLVKIGRRDAINDVEKILENIRRRS